jgi:hypothetical protein
MFSRIPEWLRSVILTFVFTLLVTVTAADFDWSQAAILAAATTALRTAVSALLPGGSFGNSIVGSNEIGDE